MEYTAADHRKIRGNAKGQVTRTGKQIDLLLGIDISQLDMIALEKHSDSLERADDAFHLHHGSLSAEEELADAERYQLETQEHQAAVSRARLNVSSLRSKHETTEVLLELESALSALEVRSKEGPSPGLLEAMGEVRRLDQQFRRSSARLVISTDPSFQKARDELPARLHAVEKLCSPAIPSPPETPSPEVRTTQFIPHSLKVELPTFDGTLLKWRDFWHLFSSLLNKQKHLDDHEKCCLLLKAMGSPEAKDRAEAAIAYTSSYAEATAKLRKNYEQNRVLHAHHVAEMIQTDYFKDEHRDLERLLDRIERNTRGLTLANGCTFEQVLSTYYERQMSPGLNTLWMRSTSELTDPPTLAVLTKFVETQLRQSANSSTIKLEKEPAPTKREKRSPSRSSGRTVLHAQKTEKCQVCGDPHSVFSCDTFTQMSTPQRRDWAKANKACFNCLGSNHRVETCPSKYRCRECRRKHHTLLHSTSSISSLDDVTVNIAHSVNSAYVLPLTAIVRVRSGGLIQKARAQLDTGASISLITRRLATTLNAKKIPNSAIDLTGIGGHLTTMYQVELTLLGDPKLGYQNELVTLRAHVVKDIPSSSSHADVRKILQLPFLNGLPLADPSYTSNSRIDLLVDVGTFNTCCRGKTQQSAIPSLKAELTIFGWTVGGTDSQEHQIGSGALSCLRVSRAVEDPERLLRRFWETEEFPSDDPSQTPEEQQACEHFRSTVQRDDDGRYRVSLPRRLGVPDLGASREIALRRYLSTERSLTKQGTWDPYRAAVAEYLSLGHAEEVPASEICKPSKCVFYLPMHGVVKSCSTSTKIRPVCDASSKTYSGVSLNDTLLPGPSLYPRLNLIINQFRLHQVAMTADVSKMYRQIGLNPEEVDYHRFLHRDDDGEIKDYRMTRLTFGVSSSPYLATQVLRQLAQDHQSQHSEAANIVKNSFYVDDVLTGSNSVSQARQLREQLNSLLSKACMPLCKWRSNSQSLLDSIPDTLREMSDLNISPEPGDALKTLGIHWSTEQDCLFAATPDVSDQSPATKRKVSSIVAKIFDPLGWFSPATLPAKVLLQESWELKLDWDDVLPPPLQAKWREWISTVPLIHKHPIPRHFGLPDKTIQYRELHGFSDASITAYGGVVYVRTFFTDLNVSVDLVSSKARVAPLKPLTVPRLELNGALLLSELMNSVAADLTISQSSLYAWSDSAVVLGWLNKSPNSLNVFVSNRVSKISSLIKPSHWRYVDTKSNPADLLSRGVPPNELVTDQMWWKGPPWLSLEPALWPRRPDINLSRELPELRPSVILLATPVEELGRNVSSFDRLVRVFCWVQRFTAGSKGMNEPDLTLFLSLSELRASKQLLLQHSQQVYYSTECSLLRKDSSLPTGNSLSSLSPFIDRQGMLRVGGRLQKSSLSDARIHPLILHPKSHIVRLLVHQTHRHMLHAGPSTIMAILSSSYHIPRLRPLLRTISKLCVPCQRAYARTSHQLMGELPASRVQPARPFSVVGVDFAGPLLTKRGNPRKPTLVKSYLCIFVCFTTKAVHLEVVSEMSTAAFLATLTRFTARRGLPSDVYSDNGTNFIGAQIQLKSYPSQSLHPSQSPSPISSDTLVQWSSKRDISWHFSPARAPHFGGLWEAAVKSLKVLLRKTLGDRTLTFEELTTVVVEAEAVLNSRPLVPLHSPPDDAVSVLTPGHFLIGAPLVSLPLPQDTTSKLTNLYRWNLVKRLSFDLSLRWKEEYIGHLQHRAKWLKAESNMKIDDVVLVKDVDSFGRNWPLGRVVKTYPSSDGYVRVVDVLMQGKVMRRPIAKLVKLLGEVPEDSPRGEYVCAGSPAAQPPEVTADSSPI